MEKSFFDRYTKIITKNQEEKITVCMFIEEVTGLKIETEEVEMDGKKIKLNISSVQRSSLFNTPVKARLLEKGYQI